MNVHVDFKTESRPYAQRRNTSRHVRIARGFDDIAMVYAIRAAVYLAEQNCPYHEEFDGNDACSMHFVGFIGDEPAGVLRARYFAEFVKLERLAVLKRFRRSTIAFELVRKGISTARRKGFRKIYGHSREGLEPFWARFGARPFADKRTIEFSDNRYTEMVIDLERDSDAIGLMSGGLVIARPEGDWDRPGILEESSIRGSTHHSENTVKTRTI